jgi:hypothetical protein
VLHCCYFFRVWLQIYIRLQFQQQCSHKS